MDSLIKKAIELAVENADAYAVKAGDWLAETVDRLVPDGEKQKELGAALKVFFKAGTEFADKLAGTENADSDA